MTDNLKTTELEEQNRVLRNALEMLLNDAENGASPDTLTVEALEAAGYEYTPAAPEWRYKVSLSYEDVIDSEDEARDESEAIEQIRDRFTSDVTELVLRGSYAEFVDAVDIKLERTE